MKFATSSWPEGQEQNMNSKSQQGLQGHKSWNIGQTQNLCFHEKRNDQTPAADSCENLWRKSKDERHSEGLANGFQTDVKGGVWVDCGLQDFGWSREEHKQASGDNDEEEEEKLPLQVRRRLPLQVDQELPVQVDQELPMQVSRKLPIQERKKLPMQVEI